MICFRNVVGSRWQYSWKVSIQVDRWAVAAPSPVVDNNRSTAVQGMK